MFSSIVIKKYPPYLKEIKSVNGSILSKIINLINLLDYCSIYLALIRGIDLSLVHLIDFIKKQL